MTTVKERLIKVGISTDHADALIKNFYIREKEDSNDSFMEYYVKSINDKVEKLDDKIDDLPTKIKNDIQGELNTKFENYPTHKNLYFAIGIATGFISLLMTVFKFLHT